MKAALPLFFLLVSCSGPEVPSTFEPKSPASPAAPTAPRPSVAAVLRAQNPLEATVCATAEPCALPEAQSGASTGSGPQHSGHDHGDQGATKPPMGHEGHSGHQH